MGFWKCFISLPYVVRFTQAHIYVKKLCCTLKTRVLYALSYISAILQLNRVNKVKY